jgi:hypothetical protein
MLRRLLPIALTALAVYQTDLGTEHRAEAARLRSPDLFQNYYVPPRGNGGVGAQLYLAPRPSPPRVGHTYYTYQPLLPHEFLYPHHRKYYRRNPDGGWTRTVVSWDHRIFGCDWFYRPIHAINPVRSCKFDPLLGNPGRFDPLPGNPH